MRSYISERFDMVSRVEIIGPEGREYVAYVEPGIYVQTQDEGRTLKVWVGERSDSHE